MTRVIEITNSDNIIDVRGVIARFEELEANRKPWCAGWNMPGYMPDSEPALFESFEDARDYIVSEMTNRWADASDEDAPSILAARDRWSHIPDQEETEQGETVLDTHYWISKVGGVDAFEDESAHDEYVQLQELLDGLKGCGGDEQWHGSWYPITLIRDSHFTDAMQELCEDIGDFPNGVPSYYVIDWEATARNLRADYSSVEFDGVTYWYR
jgi:hypothetical protein